jgi:hypothetical protein
MDENITSNDSVRTPAEPVVLNDALHNRGVAFTLAEREALGLTGRLPSAPSATPTTVALGNS